MIDRRQTGSVPERWSLRFATKKLRPDKRRAGMRDGPKTEAAEPPSSLQAESPELGS